MLLEQINVKTASKFISDHVDFVTCFHCCKYFTAPETAVCGHTLCHLCWRSCQTCPTCGKKVDKKSLTLNMHLKITADHVMELVKSFERIFGIKMDEIGVDSGDIDDNKIVKEWLSSSQNHFSAPPYSETPTSTQDILPVVEVSSSKIQVHTESNKNASPPKVPHIAPPQDDWDMIETVPDKEEITEKNKENVVGPMDLEPFYIDDNEYSAGKPRRSSRKREIKETTQKQQSSKKIDTSGDKHTSNNSSLDTTDKRLDKAKQNWKNVKKMRKEFSKLNKENKNKLNVSIEMCKKSKSVVSKQTSATPPQQSPSKVYTIEENTPDVTQEINIIDVHDISKENKIVNETKNTDTNVMDMVMKDELPDIDFNQMKENTPQETLKSNTKKKKASKKAKKSSTTKVVSTNEMKESRNSQSVAEENNTVNKEVPITVNSTNDGNHTVTIDHKNLPETSHANDDEIHITIKIGSVVTNITINKKSSDVKLNVNADQEVQASLGPNGITHTSVTESNMTKVVEVKDAQIGTDDNKERTTTTTKENVSIIVNDKSCSTKKHTASKETATVQYEITESVEKELSSIMECEEADDPANVPAQVKSVKRLGTTQRSKGKTVTQIDKTTIKGKIADNPEENLDDLDIFNSGSVKEVTVQTLKNTRGTPSDILVPTNKTRSRTQRLTEKRHRDDDMELNAKKQKLEGQDNVKSEKTAKEGTKNILESSSENTNYDAIMNQVFANIDADMNVNSKTQTITKQPLKSQTQTSSRKAVIADTQVEPSDTENVPAPKNIDQKYSENMFSTIGNIDAHVAGPETQKHIDTLLTPGMCRDLGDLRDQTIAPEAAGDVIDNGTDDVMANLGTPAMDDDSDKSVVEETPQKNNSKHAVRNGSGNRTVVSNKKLNLQPARVSTDTQDIINITDTIQNSANGNDVTVLGNNKRNASETPLTINSFVGQIKHNSTPVVARKSLNFTQNETDDDDATLCPSVHEVAQTTQEKQLMSEAFATTPRNPLQAKNTVLTPKKYVIAGSCLSSTESTNLKILCFKRKWLFVDKFTPDLTHLVVGVDDENRSQRSVKYMCALAAGKWIVSYKWVERCLEANTILEEEAFEALDSTGAAGPRRSRRAPRRLFHGITFFCMTPFTLLDMDTLKAMLEAAGASVATHVSGVCVKEHSPALLLAEPADTQEDKYTYLAMELNVVPVNYEWALNCLGGYSLCSLLDLLLCPVPLLPKATQTWPSELLAVED